MATDKPFYSDRFIFELGALTHQIFAAGKAADLLATWGLHDIDRVRLTSVIGHLQDAQNELLRLSNGILGNEPDQDRH